MNGANTLFYLELHHRFSVPLLAVEIYTELTSSAETDEDFMDAIVTTITQGCGVEEPVDEDFVYLIQRLEELKVEAAGDNGAASGKAPISGRSFGTSFAEFLRNQDTTQILGMMTNFDIAQMREWYCKVDFASTRNAMKNFTMWLIEQNTVNFEAALYGAGNSYKNDTVSSGKPVIDANSKEGMAMLRQYGVGDVSSDMLEQLGVSLQ